MSKLVFCSLVLLAVGCSSDDGDDSIISSGTGGGYALTGGTSSTSSVNVATGGQSSSATTSAATGGTSSSIGGTSAAQATTSSTASAVGGAAEGGTSAVQTTATTSVGGTSPSTGGTSSIPQDEDASTAFPVAPCAKSAEERKRRMCNVTLKSTGSKLVDRTVSYFGGCGETENSAGNGWDTFCEDIQCSREGECICELSLPRGYHAAVNAKLFDENNWSVGTAGSSEVKILWNFYINGQLLTEEDAVTNGQGGYNYYVLIDC